MTGSFFFYYYAMIEMIKEYCYYWKAKLQIDDDYIYLQESVTKIIYSLNKLLNEYNWNILNELY